MNKIKQLILENIKIYDANYLYLILSGEDVNDNNLINIILDLINDNLENYNTFITLVNLLKITIDNNNLTNNSKNKIYEYINNLLKKDCNRETFLILNNLTSYINCCINSNEQQLRDFYEKELRKNEREITNLNKMLNKKDKKLKDMEKRTKNSTKKLEEKERTIQEKERQLINLKEKLIRYESHSDELTLAEIEKLKNYFLINLEEPKSLEELVALAKDINLSENNFKRVFDIINKEYNITSNTISFPKYYQLMPQKPTKNEIFYLPYDNNSLDVIIICDLHIKNISDYFRTLLYQLNNYAVENNIKYAFILGDVFDICWEDLSKSKYEFIKRWQKASFQLEKELNKSYLNYLILGGNHDIRALKSGIDLIKNLEEESNKVKSLGYSDAKVVFGEVKRTDNNIGLHHTGKEIILPKPVYIGINENRKIKNYLNSLDSTSYFDFFGHFHYEYVNLSNGYCLVPNFTNATYPVKAYHVNFTFNEKRNIDSMSLYQLALYYRGFSKYNDIVYKKTRRF